LIYVKDPRVDEYLDPLPINERALLAMFKAIIANDRAGGWRRLTAAGSRGPGS
jgi:hypothetical protein